MEASKIKLPKATYQARITAASRGVSQNGNPKADIKLTIINSTDRNVVNDEGVTETVPVNGLNLFHTITFTDKAEPFTNGFIKSALGRKLTLAEFPTFDVQELVDKVVDGVAEGKEVENLDSNKQPIINPRTGKSAKVIRNQFSEFFS